MPPRLGIFSNKIVYYQKSLTKSFDVLKITQKAKIYMFVCTFIIFKNIHIYISAPKLQDFLLKQHKKAYLYQTFFILERCKLKSNPIGAFFVKVDTLSCCKKSLYNNKFFYRLKVLFILIFSFFLLLDRVYKISGKYLAFIQQL